MRTCESKKRRSCHFFMSLQPAVKQKKIDPEMAAASTLEERLLRERQGAYLGQVALLANREENAKRERKVKEGWLL